MSATVLLPADAVATIILTLRGTRDLNSPSYYTTLKIEVYIFWHQVAPITPKSPTVLGKHYLITQPSV